MDGEQVRLTFSEFELLDALMADPGPAAQPPGAAAGDLGRQRLPRPARDRRPHPPSAREARARAREAALHPHRAGRRVPPARALDAAERPRRGALGLRGRIVGALLVTTVATLGVAALALLGPLEQRAPQRGAKHAASPRSETPISHPSSSSPLARRSSTLNPPQAFGDTRRPTRRDAARLERQRRRTRFGARRERCVGYPACPRCRRNRSAADGCDTCDHPPGRRRDGLHDRHSTVESFGSSDGQRRRPRRDPGHDRRQPRTCWRSRKPIDRDPGAVARRPHGLHLRPRWRGWP